MTLWQWSSSTSVVVWSAATPRIILERRWCACSCTMYALATAVSNEPTSLLATAGVLPLAGRANQAAARRHLDVACGQVTRRGGCRWPGLGQAHAQLAVARPCHHPRPSAGLNWPSLALLCVYEKRLKKTHVASVCFKCFRCFRGMLQVFQMNIVKVDQDVSYVAIPIFHLCFQTCAYLDVTYVFTHMFQAVSFFYGYYYKIGSGHHNGSN
jgi:hypothetical protein